MRVVDEEQALIGGLCPIQSHPHHPRACAHIDAVGGLVESCKLYRAPACSVARFGQTRKSRTRVSGPQSLITHMLHQLTGSRSRAEASVEEERTAALERQVDWATDCGVSPLQFPGGEQDTTQDIASYHEHAPSPRPGMSWQPHGSSRCAYCLVGCPRFGSHAVCVLALPVAPVSNRP